MNARHALILMTIVVAAAGCQQVLQPASPSDPAPPSAGEIAFELAPPNEAAILVPVTINGRGPYSFVLDTGATLTCVDQRLVSELDLPPRKGIGGIGATIGSSGNVSLLAIEAFTVGDSTIENVTACAVDLAHLSKIGLEVDGLLGLNVLKAFDVAIDFDRRVLRLTDPASGSGDDPS